MKINKKSKFKFAIGAAIGFTTIATATTVPLVLLNSNSISDNNKVFVAKQNSVNFTNKEKKFVIEETSSKFIFSPEEYENLSKKAQNNAEIRNWIHDLATNNLDFSKSLNNLNNLKISDDLKKFMFNNLKDKMGTRKVAKISNNINASRLNSRRSSYVVKPDGKLLENSSGYVYNRGHYQQTPEIHDSWFGDDVSYIWQDSQIIYNMYLSSLDDDFVRDMQTNFELFENMRAEIETTLRLFNYTSPFDNELYDSKEQKMLIRKIINTLLSNNPANKAAIDFFNRNSEMLINIGVLSEELTFFPSLLGVLQNNADSINQLSDNLISWAIPLLMRVPEVGPLLFSGAVLINEILHMPSGNGYSFFENMHDHGLNDWNYQMRHNFYNMATLANRWSKNYGRDFYDGVVWKVTDGWFTLPELYIRAQNESNWKHLSPGDSFNWGNKISIHHYK